MRPPLAAAMCADTAAVLLEPVQGESGIHPASAQFLRTARSICDDYGALLLFDEVQCGLGRTGDWGGWRSIAPDVVPDGVSWAKGIAGGFPLGAIWVRDRAGGAEERRGDFAFDLLGAGLARHDLWRHAAGLRGRAGSSEHHRGGRAARACHRSSGAYAHDALEGLASPLIAEVRGLGLMIGIQLVADFAERARCGSRPPSLWLVDRLHEAGLLTIPSGTHAIRWLPPLNVSRAEIDQAVAILSEVLKSIP